MTLAAGRRMALSALARARHSDSWLREVLDSADTPAGAHDSDAAFARRLALGVASTQGALDIALDRYIPRPKDVSPAARDALRLAAYELLFERTEAHIAVHQGVEAVKSVAKGADKFANAVLRRLAEDAPSFPWGDPDTDTDALALLTGHPSWLVAMLADEYGSPVAREILAANNTPAPLYVAHNPFVGGFEDALDALREDGAEPVATDVAGCILCESPAPAARGKALASGKAVVADASAQLVCRLVLPPHGATVVDVGAGRGTKTLLLQAAAGGEASITAVDLHAFKVDVLSARMAELNVPGVTAAVADATNPDDLRETVGGFADLVLVDAPCSNLGTLRRHPEKRWRLAPDDLPRLAELGNRLLRAASRLVTDGGFVVYSTCTILRRENEDVITAFLSSADGEGFVTESVRDVVPDGWSRFVTDEGWFRSIPRENGPDGHFAAVLRKTRG